MTWVLHVHVHVRVCACVRTGGSSSLVCSEDNAVSSQCSSAWCDDLTVVPSEVEPVPPQFVDQRNHEVRLQ